ncbi:DUF397 domain-containing protein [Nonomuraea guangzhouensis]|uniref:DUF397 domain-containing protein n=1 Tax=Nonomuraea guangzhouensis TaxID=1291555 RepID=A0ABW4GMT5_9ACTN|nr:DUF397 domain-containing protein [Nonomuraea guangzhouensis]
MAHNDTPDLQHAEWRKSSHSGGDGGNCVEVATNLPGVIAVRNSRHRSDKPLIFTPSEWAAFLAGVNDGEFDIA